MSDQNELNPSLQWKSLDGNLLPFDHTQPETKGGGSNIFKSDFLSRREFMEWTGGMVALLSTVGCTRQPEQHLIPYSKAPEEIVPGVPLFFTSAMMKDGYANGVLIESHMGRPTKVEGNPEHPSSVGHTDSFAQASVLSLYDPDRLKSITGFGNVQMWAGLVGKINAALQTTPNGAGLRILTGAFTSPTLAAQISELLKKYPQAVWHQYEPLHRDNEREGSRIAYGSAVDSQYHFDKAAVILSLDSDFFTVEPGHVRYMRDWATQRQVIGGRKQLNRLYAVESSPTLVGAKADHRLAARQSEIENLAGAIAAAVGVAVKGVGSLNPQQQKFVNAVAGDLKAHRGSSLVLAGRWQSPMVHALAHAINERLGNVGTTVTHTDTAEARIEGNTESLRKLTTDMAAGKVLALVMLGGTNPVYTAPTDLNFAAALKKVPFTLYHTLYNDETGEHCQYVVPATHYMEEWSDARAYDGTATIVQPLIAPLYGGKSAHEMVASLAGDSSKSGYDLVRDYWAKQAKGDFEKWWRKTLNDGFVAGSAPAAKKAALKPEGGWAVVTPPTAPKAGTVEMMFRPDPTVWDGRYANNGWLQELPKPLTKLTWDNAVLFSPATAKKMGLVERDVVTLDAGGRKINAPVWIQPGHPEDAITVTFGYGRTRAGRLGNGAGFNAYVLRTTATAWGVADVAVHKLGRTYQLAQTQRHDNMEEREPVRHTTLKHHLEDVKWVEPKEVEPKTATGVDPGTAGGIYAPKGESDYKWGMSINLNSCTGCGSCVVACQSENNIPIVGKVEVQRGRAMHWLRVDRYFEGSPENPETHFQPVPCMHCETAPCEVVCPVGATVHDNEGLNNMVYNRCVGTKYCSNNCPYKVRHFNFYEYSDMDTPVLKLGRNPDVTVRSRGVMEKCSYCVQRISHGRINAKNEHRKIKDGEVKTACQSACPADAIIFGDLSDPNSLVSKMKAEPINYGLLAELNTKPRTTYLAKVTNPNAELEEGAK